MIKWAGYDDDQNTWEPERNLISNNLLLKFEMEEKKKQKKIEKEEKKMKQIVRAKEVPSIGDLCFAKVRGYAPWPAIVTKIEKPTVWVKFFNSSQR